MFESRGYNSDFVITTDKGEIIVEVDGIFWHGLVDNGNYEMKQRRLNHEKKVNYYKANCKLPVYHLTDKQIKEYLNQKGLEVNINNEDTIRYRDILRGGRVECYQHKIEINTEEVMRGFDITSLYPSMLLMNLPLRESNIVEGGD